jgi:hypothetical protein
MCGPILFHLLLQNTMTNNTCTATDFLLPVAEVDSEDIVGVARIHVTPTICAVLSEAVQALSHEDDKEVSVLTRRCEDCGPAAWYPTEAVNPTAMANMEEEVYTNGLDYTEAVFPTGETNLRSMILPPAPEPDYPLGGLSGYTHLRAIDMHTDGRNVWWTAIASRGGDSEDARVQTSLLPLAAIPFE